jgi:hypothetical protein
MTTANLVRARHKAQPAGGVPLWRATPSHPFRPIPDANVPSQCWRCWGWYDDPAAHLRPADGRRAPPAGPGEWRPPTHTSVVASVPPRPVASGPGRGRGPTS